ncbi:MAG: toxic anion resistance protein [Clostridia bacterium]|nr:toxic anion resistance protein [Clostridia bacterium]
MTGIDFASAPAAPTVTLELTDTSSSMNSIQNTTDTTETVTPSIEPAFSEQELAQIASFSEKIDITNPELVLQYGAGAQKKIAAFSDTTLERVRTKDSGFVGDMLTDLIGELKGFSTENTNFKGKGTWRIRRMISKLKAQYSKVSTNVGEIVDHLEEHQLTLMDDIKVLNGLYDRNQLYFKELSMYIKAGQQRLEHLRATRLQELYDAAQSNSSPQAAQAYKDFADACNRFEKKLHDLLLSRTVAMQFAAQIRLLQNNDSILVDKIQSTIVNTIPLWKSQMVVALGLANATNAMRAQRSVTNMTNSLLRSNAEKLKTSTVEIARESERGIIDIETLVHTNQMLIDTITEVQQIQAEGREQRQNAEAELKLLEGNLKQQLLKNK